nr:hypothetical protein [Tanacetum cinerariifolium]
VQVQVQDQRFHIRLIKIQVAQKKVKIAFENADSSLRVELIPSKIKIVVPTEYCTFVILPTCFVTLAWTRDSRTDLSFDIPASPECMSDLAHASSGEATWLVPSHVLSCDVAGLGGKYVTGRARLRLSAHVVKLRDILEGVLVLSGLSQVWKSQTRDSILKDSSGNSIEGGGMLCFFSHEESHHDIRLTSQRIPFYCTHPATADSIYPDSTPKNLAAGTPSAKVIAKAEASKKQKASLFGMALSYVPKHNRFAMDQLSRSTSWANLFADNTDVESDDDEDACVEIPLVTSIYSTTVIPIGGSQARGSVPPTAEDPSTRGKHHYERCYRCIFQRTSFHLLLVLIMPLTLKMKLPVHATILEAKKDAEIIQLKASPLEFTSFFCGSCLSLVRKFFASDEFSRVQGELLSLAANAGFECGLSVDQTQEEFVRVLKKIFRFMHGALGRLVEASPLPKQLAHLDDASAQKDTYVSPPVAKESIMTPLFSSLKLPSNDVPFSSGVSHTVGEDPGSPLAQGSKHVSFDPNDVVVALSVREKASIVGLVLMPTDTSWLRNYSLMDASPVSNSTFGLKALGSCTARFSNHPLVPESFSISTMGPSVTTLTLCFQKLNSRTLSCELTSRLPSLLEFTMSFSICPSGPVPRFRKSRIMISDQLCSIPPIAEDPSTRGDFKDLVVCNIDVDQFPTPREMILVRKFLASDEFSRVQGELLSLAASAGFKRGLSVDQTREEFFRVLKKIFRFVPVGEDVGSPLAQRSKRVSFGPNDVVVGLSVGEKGNGSPLFPSAAKEAVASPSRV